MKKPKVKTRFSFIVPILTLGIFLCAFNAWAIVPDVNTGSFDYWKGASPAKYIYDVNRCLVVNTGTIDYWDEDIPAKYVYEGDNVPPTCTISRDDPDPINTSSVNFSVDFSEAVVGFEQGDVDLTGTAPGKSFTGFTGSGAEYTITVSGISGSGTVSIDVDDGVCTDAAGNTNTAGVAVQYTIDQDAPEITSITSTTDNGSYKAGDSVNITVNFDEAVTLSGGNLVITLETGSTDREVTISSISGSTTASGTYTVQAGDISADLTANSLALSAGTLRDAVGNDADLSIPGGQNLADNKDIVIDTTAPTIGISAPSTNLTNTGPVTYTVTYTGADTVELVVGNITLNSTGGASGTVGVSVNGTESATVTISSIAGDGTLGISIASGTAADDAGNEAPSAGPSATFTVDNSDPGINIGAPSAGLTNTGPVTYTITYTDADFVTLTEGNVTLDTTGNADGMIDVTGSGNASRTVEISGITGDGTIGISIAAGTASDNAGNPADSAGPSSTFSVDNTDPGISIGAPSVNLTNDGPVTYTITYSNADSITLGAGNITLVTTGDATGSIGVSGSDPAERTVTISSITGDGTIGISIASGTASDDAGNQAPSAGPSSTFTVDNIAPTVNISAPSESLTINGPVTYTITYGNADFVTLTDSDVTLNKTDTANGSVEVSGSDTSERTVTISSIAGDGTLGISIAAATASDNAGNDSAAAGPSTTFTVDNTDPSSPTLALTDQTTASADYTNSQTVNADITEGGDVVAWILSETITTAPAAASGDWEGSEPTTYTFDNGDNELKTVYVWVKDQAGNVYQTPVTDTITLDTEAPNAPVITGFDVGSQGRITVIRGTVEAGITVYASIDGSAYLADESSGNWTYSTSPALPADYHSIYAYAVDQVENQSPDSDTHITHGSFVNVFQDTDTYHSGSGTVSLRLNKTTVYLYEVAVNESIQVSVSAYIQKNIDYGADTQPKITLTGLGIDGTGAATDSMTEVADTWEELNVSGTPTSKGVLILKIETYGTADGAKVWIDDIAVTQ